MPVGRTLGDDRHAQHVVAPIKLLPVTLGITAMQLEFAAKTRLVKLHVIDGGTVSSTRTVRVTVLVLPLPSTAVYVTRLLPRALMLTVPFVAQRNARARIASGHARILKTAPN